MAYQKLKKEQYINVGGISTKASVYVTDDRSVLDLVNYDLQNTAAWTQRPGITNALSGNTLAIGASNRINFGFQTYRIFNFYPFGISFSQRCYIQSNSQTYSLSLTNGVVSTVSGGTLATTIGPGNYVNILTTSGGGTTFYVFSNAFFVSDNKTYKSNAINGVFYFGLPYPNDSTSAVGALTFGFTGSGSATGTYTLKGGYRDVFDGLGIVNDLGAGAVASANFNLNISAATFTANAYASGATSIIVYSDRVLGFNATDYVSVGELYPGTTLTVGFTSGLMIPNSDYGELAPDRIANISPTTAGAGVQGFLINGNVMEYYSNRLWIGVSAGENKVYYSDPIETAGDEEAIESDSFLVFKQVNYPLIGLKAYNQSLIILFQKGVFRLTGDNPDNFSGLLLTSDYGLINSRAIVTFRDIMWFMDEKQIIQFNGANFDIVSNPILSYMQRMNVAAAQKTANAYHYEDRNEIWFTFPLDSSEENNIICVFDYNSNGWYTIKSPSNFTTLQQFVNQTFTQGLTSSTIFLNDPKLYTGHPGGSFGYFTTDAKTDFGNAFTLTFKTKYHTDGHSVTSEWRRFYLDTGPWAGATLAFQANMYANFSTSTISLTRTIYASGSPYSGPQQSRIDFGIPAKSLSVETHVTTGASLPIIKVYGYTIESRFLRNV